MLWVDDPFLSFCLVFFIVTVVSCIIILCSCCFLSVNANCYTYRLPSLPKQEFSRNISIRRSNSSDVRNSGRAKQSLLKTQNAKNAGMNQTTITTKTTTIFKTSLYYNHNRVKTSNCVTLSLSRKESLQGKNLEKYQLPKTML